MSERDRLVAAPADASLRKRPRRSPAPATPHQQLRPGEFSDVPAVVDVC
jgi:hypothetical protein